MIHILEIFVVALLLMWEIRKPTSKTFEILSVQSQPSSSNNNVSKDINVHVSPDTILNTIHNSNLLPKQKVGQVLWRGMEIGVNCVLRQWVGFPTWQTACSGARLPKSEDVTSLVVVDTLATLGTRWAAPGGWRPAWPENSSDRWPPDKHSLRHRVICFFASWHWKDWVGKKVIWNISLDAYFLFLSPLVHIRITQAKSFQREIWKETFTWMKWAAARKHFWNMLNPITRESPIEFL